MPGLSDRIRQIRVERFGEDGTPSLAEELGLPARTWLNYERGVVVPGPVLLAFIDRVGLHPHWLLTGEGEPYRADAGATGRVAGPASHAMPREMTGTGTMNPGATHDDEQGD